MLYLALTAAFLLELIAFVSFAAFGYLLHLSTALHLALFVILLSVLIGFWALFMAPRAVYKFKVLPYYLAKGLIYAISATTLFALKGPLWGGLFVILALVDELVLFKHNLS